MIRIGLLIFVGMTLALAACTSSPATIKSENTEVINNIFSEIWSKGNVDLIDNLFAENFIGHFPEGTVTGREGMRASVVAHRTSFPDWKEEIADTIADGDRVVVRFISRGTNLGVFLNNPPTGNRVEISEVAIFRLKDGKVIEQWVYPDILSLQRQLSE